MTMKTIGDGVSLSDINTQKIDNLATLGLSGTHNSLSYRIEEIERHFHGREKWFGVALSASGEVHVADRMNIAASAFTLTATQG